MPKTNKATLLLTADASWLAVPENPSLPAMDVTESFYGLLTGMVGPELVAEMQREVRKAGQEHYRNAFGRH